MKVHRSTHKNHIYVQVPQEEAGEIRGYYFGHLDVEIELERAAKRNDFRAVRVFATTADFNKDFHEMPPLFWAIFNKNYQMVSFLIRKMDYNTLNKLYIKMDCTPMMYAILYGNLLAVEMLMTRRVNLRIKDSMGFDAYYWALMCRDKCIQKEIGIYDTCCSIV